MRSLPDIAEEYAFLEGDERYRLLIELGRELDDMPAALKTDATLVRGHDGGAVCQHLALQHHAADIRRLKAGNDAQQARFTRARRPNDGRAAAARHAQVNAFEGLHVSIRFVHAVQFKSRHRPAMRRDWRYSIQVSGKESNTMSSA